ncbi:MAG: hypothetical protein IKM13_02210 [Clostridia bacterium]|nr:hypothetical protein [Clostridia bacterium]
MNRELEKSVDFLLEYAGPVIRYRLKKEILGDISPGEEEALLNEICALPMMMELMDYVKPNGYIGSGMHSWDNWRGQVLHKTPLQDGETAARLLSNYRIPKQHPLVADYVKALRDEEILRQEFSYIPPEITRFENRFLGLENGNSLMALVYTMEAMLGYGDDFLDTRDFQEICLEGFRTLGRIGDISEITRERKTAGRYHYPYIEADTPFPDSYTLAMLAYTRNWRTPERVAMLTHSLNHAGEIMKPDTNIHVKIGNKYMAPCFALTRPILPFHPDTIQTITYRRLLSEIAMLGVGRNVAVIRESEENIRNAMDENGVLRMNFSLPHNKRYSPKALTYPTAYVDVRLEADYKNHRALDCDLTFWAVEFLTLLDKK